jgi:hypothetical protein
MKTFSVCLSMLCGVILAPACGGGGSEGTRGRVELLAPPDGSTQDSLSVRFLWETADAPRGTTFCAWVLLDKGRDPFDGDLESTFLADGDGHESELRIDLDRRFYGCATFEWGVTAVACSVSAASCPCEGRDLRRSAVRRMSIDVLPPVGSRSPPPSEREVETGGIDAYAFSVRSPGCC